MEMFWFFWLRFRRAYDSANDSDFLSSLGHKRTYDSAYDSDSVASEKPLALIRYHELKNQKVTVTYVYIMRYSSAKKHVEGFPARKYVGKHVAP